MCERSAVIDLPEAEIGEIDNRDFTSSIAHRFGYSSCRSAPISRGIDGVYGNGCATRRKAAGFRGESPCIVAILKQRLSETSCRSHNEPLSARSLSPSATTNRCRLIDQVLRLREEKIAISRLVIGISDQRRTEREREREKVRSITIIRCLNVSSFRPGYVRGRTRLFLPLLAPPSRHRFKKLLNARFLFRVN